MTGLFTFIYKLLKTGRPSNRNEVHEFGFHQDGMPIGERLNAVLMKIRQELGESPDLITRKFEMPNVPHIPIAAVYMEGLTNKDKINDFAERLLFYEPDNVENANKAAAAPFNKDHNVTGQQGMHHIAPLMLHLYFAYGLGPDKN